MGKQKSPLGASYSQPTLNGLLSGRDFLTLVKGKNYLIIEQPQPSDVSFTERHYGLFVCGADDYEEYTAVQDTVTNVFSDQFHGTDEDYSTLESELKVFKLNATVYLVADADISEVTDYLGF